jgi:SAM-dependent methyltransferase
VAVPGCGRGHDARFLAQRGYRVVAFDFVREIVAEARELALRDGVDVAFEERDVFGLPGEHAGHFDGVWEYTCFCAIDPARRAAYVDVLARILKPGGWLLACFFPMDPPGRSAGSPDGPPFPVKQAEVRALLADRFDLVEDYVPSASPEGRQGREWVVSARRRASDRG